MQELSQANLAEQALGVAAVDDRRAVPGGIVGGCHDDAFWARNLPAALQFIAGHLG